MKEKMKPLPPIIPYFCDYCKKIHDEGNNQEDEWDIHIVFLNEEKTKVHLDSIGKLDDFETLMEYHKIEKSKSKRVFTIIALGGLLAASGGAAIMSFLPNMAMFEIPLYLKVILILLAVFLMIFILIALYISSTAWKTKLKGKGYSK